ncbi:dna polymerase i [Leptolyngbya sp. Heron Island J]|uniref:DNA polymerase I n=1 Tax=Leptolyngbya sp. Heron Island J TaxID=1385935 RepID=UPI0003B944B4|nr:DNA polymerase I [Leptolyngbya sp. Heron Island J]ESA33567.1 dna polymerase i [Leptolyngbya sp. Heron Island J]
MSSDRPTLLIIDGHSLAFRSYYAHAKSRDGGLRTSKGIPTSVCFGFLKSMSDMMVVEKPDYAAVAFDLAQPTFRHEAADTYKEGRPEAPEDFLEDVENLKQLLAGFQLPILTAPGFEADDVIGTLATKAEKEGYAVRILSGDQDLFQLIDNNEHIKVLHLGSTFGRTNGLAKEYGIKEVEEKLGIKPNQVIDYKALCGDTSDNIPGVKGIGKKTAVKLLTEHQNLEGVYAALPEMKGAVKKRLETGQDDANQSKYLATIVTDVDLDVELADCKLEGFDEAEVVPLLKHLEFQHFINRLSKLQEAFGGEVKASSVKVATSFEDEDLAFFTAEETDVAREVEAVDIKPQIVTTAAQLQDLVTKLETQTDKAKPVAWDTETTAIDPLDADLVGIGCCWGDGPEDIAYVPVGHVEGTQLPLADVLAALKPVLESADCPKSLQNAKYDRAVFKRYDIELTGVVFDTMLASYVLNPENSHNLTDLSLRYLNVAAQSYSDLVPKGKTIADIALDQVAAYCGEDVHTTYRLVPILQKELSQVDAIATLFRDIEVPLEAVLADMEATGIRIDEPYLKQFSEQLEADLYELQIKAYDYAGEEFNLASPKQLSVLLFETLGLNKKKTRKTKTGYSTDASTLEKLQGDHPVVDCIISHRTLSKLKSTYVDALPKLVRADTGRVHTDFNQAVTATGRLSSSNPNLQNIPVRTAFSRQIRQAFLPQEGWLLAAADYSQIELRILTHLSGESVLVDAYRNGQDVHSLTAQLLLDKEEISTAERRMGKIINFGVIYGMGAVRFAREMGVSRTEAKAFIDKFNERYSRVFEYLQQMQREAIAYGYVETILGRRRYFNFSSNSLKPLKGKSPDEIDLDHLRPGGYDAGLLRAAANAPIQGSSADIIKIAMIQLHKVLKDYQARLLLQVHDELIFEIPLDEWPELEKKIATTMESVVQLSVPLKVDINAGKNWMDAK